MKIVQINTVFQQGSTGKIAAEIQSETIKCGYENIVAYRFAEGEHARNTYCVSTWLDCHIHNRIARYTHLSGFYSRYRTAKFIKYLINEQVDVIHLHNLHGSYINIIQLFNYIKKYGIKTVWTFHDCWPFTGYCPYFEIVGCNHWLNDCKKCCYETNLLNWNSAAKCLRAKKNLVCGLDLTVVVPSRWMEQLVRKTFYSNFDIRIITNGIDLSVFHPIASDAKEKYGFSLSKYIIIGVASVWNQRKGIDVFSELSKRLNMSAYQIVLVGEKPQLNEENTDSIVHIDHVNDQKVLAELYSVADVFVNPTREETLGMVNIEALACGTPVVTFNTGGSPECIDATCGSVVVKDDIDGLEKEIIRICETKPYSRESCVKRARAFDKNEKFQEYIELYKEITNE